MKPETASARRRFLGKASAALAAPLAIGAAPAAAGAAQDDAALSARLRRLEDLEAIRELNRLYVRRVNARAHDQIAGLFSDPGDARVEDGIRSLSLEDEPRDLIEIAPDHRTATARIHCNVLVEARIEPSCPLVEMAVQQGGGVLKRRETGVLDLAYVKAADAWKIKRVLYRPA